ncbi:acylneuraminate cytidylyltransferase [Salipaludibacillus neizhouensis]|uniref:Acylneuraminate cytidylyltransferase n=1 Tax=Salipaludibacillus neizhouensis TaxID=885475 RepID=A0A3A9KJV5_9BACI|nr:acylneuraminate cytidylyltransferase family protein [Salipaludibacillus neizhouensis]RKL68055.1 acylneuraminate cytidylyltransferase [Salipaludibacillus neizhouensis]
MYEDKTFLAVIPARGGSKGIPGKNIYEVNGRPLIDYTIKEALGSKYLDKVIVSTDCEKIANISREYGAEVPFLRPKELAQDKSRTIDGIIDLLNRIKEQYDYLVLLQPTQPLRRSVHIDEAIELITDKEVQSLVSVNEVKDNPILMRTLNEDNQLKSIININSTVRRQDFPQYYKVNGSIYINRIDEKLNLNTSFNDNVLAYNMDKKYDLDIDEIFDLEVFKLKLRLFKDKK